MYASYEDIRSRIAEVPAWFDHDGVPRYGDYKVGHSTIYAKVSVLFEVQCQGCGLLAKVSNEFSSLFFPGDFEEPTATDQGSLHYGDFPRGMGPDGKDCCGGTTMTTSITRIIEFWRRNKDHEWERMPQFEFTYQEGVAVEQEANADQQLASALDELIKTDD